VVSELDRSPTVSQRWAAGDPWAGGWTGGLPLSVEVRRYALLADAAHRLRIAHAVLDHLTAGAAKPADPLVVSLACDELRHAEQAYLQLRDAP
jgi:hypothetical protein